MQGEARLHFNLGLVLELLADVRSGAVEQVIDAGVRVAAFFGRSKNALEEVAGGACLLCLALSRNLGRRGADHADASTDHAKHQRRKYGGRGSHTDLVPPGELPQPVPRTR